MGAPLYPLEYDYFSMKELIGVRLDVDGVRRIKVMKKTNPEIRGKHLVTASQPVLPIDFSDEEDDLQIE